MPAEITSVTRLGFIIMVRQWYSPLALPRNENDNFMLVLKVFWWPLLIFLTHVPQLIPQFSKRSIYFKTQVAENQQRKIVNIFIRTIRQSKLQSLFES